MEVTATYDWEGNLSGYQWDNMSVPIAEDNKDYQMIKEAIANDTCIVNEPTIEEVTAAYNRKGVLSGYKWNHIFVPVPTDESKPFYRMVKKAIEDNSCIIKDPAPEQADKPISNVKTIIFCIFFNQPWPHVKSPYEGEISYRSNEEAESRTYTFRLINLSSDGRLNGFDLLFDYHPGIPKGQLPIELPLQSGILELEVPVVYLQKLFRNERPLLERSMASFIDSIVVPHLRESGRREPDIEHLISYAKSYLGNFIMEVGNRVIEAFTREYGGLPIGYIDKWRIYEETIVINKYQDGTYRLGAFGLQGKQNFGLSGEWSSWSQGLLQMSEPEKHPTNPYDYALQRCRMLLKAGLHIEAFCLLNTLLEVNIRDVLCYCVISDPETQNFIAGRMMPHRERLEILKKIAKSTSDDVIRSNINYLTQIENAEKIYNLRNDYIHALILPEAEEKRPEFERMNYLGVRQRQYLEELMYGFIDFHESRLWFGMQYRLANGKDNSAVEIIQEAMKRRKVKDE